MVINNSVDRTIEKAFHSMKSLRICVATASALIAVFCLAVASGPAFSANSSLVKEGDKAPDFTLKDENGKSTTLGDFKGNVFLVYFYDKDNEPPTDKDREDTKKRFKKYKLDNVDILCVGPNPVQSHKAMNSGLALKFHLLTDKDDTIRKQWGLPKAVKGNHAHYAFVVGKDLAVKKVYGAAGERVPGTNDMVKALDYIGDSASVSAF